MNRLEMLRVLVVAAEHRNFRDAAKQLGVSAQVVTRNIRNLEEDLGEVLFHRSTRGVQLTGFGRTLAESAREAVLTVDGLFQHSNRRQLSENFGMVRITAPPFLIREPLLHLLSKQLIDLPGITLDWRLSDDWTDTVNQQIDIGIRLGPLRDRRWIAKEIHSVPFYIVASPSLLEVIGYPRHISELEKLPTTVLIDHRSGRIWPWMFSNERRLYMTKPALIVDDPEAECAAILAGSGIGQLSGLLAAPHLKSGRLIALLNDDMPEPWTLFVYRPQSGPVPARVRLVFDALCNALRQMQLTI